MTAAATTQRPQNALMDEFGVTPDEVAELLGSLRAAKAAKAKADEAARITRETGYPKRLYNSKFQGESLLLPGGVARIGFYRGVMEVTTAEEEAFVRSVCAGRVFEADLPREKTCDRCGYVTASMDCWDAHVKEHMA